MVRLTDKVYFGRAVSLLAFQSSPDMKVAITFCIFSIAILLAFAEESSKESLQARESRDAFTVQKEIPEKQGRRTKSKKKPSKKPSKKQKKKLNKKPCKQGSRKKPNKKPNKKQSKKQSKKGSKKRKSNKPNKKPSKQGLKNKRRLRQSRNLTKKDVNTYKKIRNLISQKKRCDNYIKTLQKKGNTTIFAEAANTLGKLTNNGTGVSETANSAYFFLKNCSTSVPKFCSSANLTLNETDHNATQCLEQFSTFKTYMDCQKNNPLNKCNATVPADCKNLTKATEEANKRKKECVSTSTVGSFAYCMNFIKSDLLGATASLVGRENCTSIAPNSTVLPPTECKTVRTEGGEVITEESSFNRNTRELTISVPAHGSRDAATFIIGETKTCIVYPNECLVSDSTRDDLDLLNGAENTGDGCKDTAELQETDLSKSCSLNIDQGILSADQIAQLPKSVQDACDGKTVRGTLLVDASVETCTTNVTINGTDVGNCPKTTTPSPGCANKKV